MRAILETSPDGLITIDEDGIIQSFNPAAERMFGYQAIEVIGRNVSCLMPSAYREEHDDLPGALPAHRGKADHRHWARSAGQRSDGTIFPLELAVGEVKAAGRRLFAGFVKDVSARQQSEHRLQELQSELIYVARLSAMGEMASALAHELNQLLTAIINYAQTARGLVERREGKAVGGLASLLDKTVQQAGRAGQIIRRLRQFMPRARPTGRSRTSIASWKRRARSPWSGRKAKASRRDACSGTDCRRCSSTRLRFTR